MRSESYRRVLFILLCVTFLLNSNSFAQNDADDPYYIAPDRVMSYTQDIKPILNAKCVGCHACFDSPAQLNFTNAKGVQRGAIKFDPYAPRWNAVPAFRLENTSMSVDDFRELGFFSVLEGGKDSLMGKMLKLGYENQWKPNERIPAHITVDAIEHKLVAPNLKELPGYAAAYPKQGMPFAVAGLTAQEYAAMMKWLEQGAKFDEAKPQPHPQDIKTIQRWETFLNTDDDQHRLVSRYIYEHSSPLHYYFGDPNDADGTFYMLVRSKTSPGEDIVPIETRCATHGIDGKFYYRLNPLDVTRHHKRHIPLDARNKLERYKEIFFSKDWAVERLPGHTDAERYSPLQTFAAIPAKARYLYLLESCYEFERCIQQSASCRFGVVVSVTPDQAWHFFENPETSLYINDKGFRRAVTPLLAEAAEDSNILGAAKQVQGLIELNREYRQKAVNTLANGARSRIVDIWKGNKPGDVPAYTAFRHDDNAGGRPGLVGDYPKRVVVQDLPIFERRLYTAYINFDLFSEMPAWISIRLQFGLWRTCMEMNFVRFLPADRRLDVLTSWYKGGLSQFALKKGLPKYNIDIPTGVTYETDDPKREFLDQVMAHLDGSIPTEDPIARPKAGVEYDQVTKAMQLIDQKGDTENKFKLFMPEASFLRIDSEGKPSAVYTMTIDWDVASKFSMADELIRQSPLKDRVTVYPKVMCSYPNFIFKIDEKEAMVFARALTSAKDEDAFRAVVDRWGVRRTSPDFWATVHSITDFQRKTEPRASAIFDVNRYDDF